MKHLSQIFKDQCQLLRWLFQKLFENQIFKGKNQRKYLKKLTEEHQQDGACLKFHSYFVNRVKMTKETQMAIQSVDDNDDS